MILDEPVNYNKSEQRSRLHALCDLGYVAIWFFVVGPVLFGVRPTIKLYRETGYMRLGDYEGITKD